MISTKLISILKEIVEETNVFHLAYSGGIDSTIILALLSKLKQSHTYTISSREDHPDIIHARLGSQYYGSVHHEYIVEPNTKKCDEFTGDNAVRMLFECIETNSIICCYGIDELMCGYYAHQDCRYETFFNYLGKLEPDHLVPLLRSSVNHKVYFPYLDGRFIDASLGIPLKEKVDKKQRKKIIYQMAEELGIPREIQERRKYGFCDAFKLKDKN